MGLRVAAGQDYVGRTSLLNESAAIVVAPHAARCHRLWTVAEPAYRLLPPERPSNDRPRTRSDYDPPTVSIARLHDGFRPRGVRRRRRWLERAAAGTTGTANRHPDGEPDAFTIQPFLDAPRGLAVSSQAVTIQGINISASVSIAGGEYSVSGGAFTSAAGTVANAQSIVVRVTAAAAPGGSAQATLTVGSVAATFAVTTSTDVTPPTATVVFPTAQSRTSSEQLIVRAPRATAAARWAQCASTASRRRARTISRLGPRQCHSPPAQTRSLSTRWTAH